MSNLKNLFELTQHQLQAAIELSDISSETSTILSQPKNEISVNSLSKKLHPPENFVTPFENHHYNL